jgi:peptide/nickel transport system ATP-binding protein
VLIADEQVSALDVSVQAQILRLLAEISERFCLTMLFITHDLRVATQVCDRLAVMHRGPASSITARSRRCSATRSTPIRTRQLFASIPALDPAGLRTIGLTPYGIFLAQLAPPDHSITWSARASRAD